MTNEPMTATEVLKRRMEVFNQTEATDIPLRLINLVEAILWCCPEKGGMVSVPLCTLEHMMERLGRLDKPEEGGQDG